MNEPLKNNLISSINYCHVLGNFDKYGAVGKLWQWRVIYGDFGRWTSWRKICSPSVKLPTDMAVDGRHQKLTTWKQISYFIVIHHQLYFWFSKVVDKQEPSISQRIEIVLLLKLQPHFLSGKSSQKQIAIQTQVLKKQ